MKNKIDIESLTEKEAKEILELIRLKFNIVAMCYGTVGMQDVSFLDTMGEWDDNFHAKDWK